MPAAAIGGEFDTMWILLTAQQHRESPTDKLLKQWGHQNPTVELLELMLRSLNLIRAADILRNHYQGGGLVLNVSNLTGLLIF